MVSEDDEATLVDEEGVSLDNESVRLVNVVRLQVAVLFEKLLPVDRQLSLDQVQHAELHGLHTFLVCRFLHELVGEVLAVPKLTTHLKLFTSFAFFVISSSFKGLFTVKRVSHDQLCVCIFVVKVQLNAEVIPHLRLVRHHRLDLRVIATPSFLPLQNVVVLVSRQSH